MKTAGALERGLDEIPRAVPFAKRHQGGLIEDLLLRQRLEPAVRAVSAASTTGLLSRQKPPYREMNTIT